MCESQFKLCELNSVHKHYSSKNFGHRIELRE